MIFCEQVFKVDMAQYIKVFTDCVLRLHCPLIIQALNKEVTPWGHEVQCQLQQVFVGFVLC